MSDEKPTDPTKAKFARKPKIVKQRPNSTVVPARTKADKAKRERAKNFVQIELPKSLATMTDEEIMQWATGMYKSVVAQLIPSEDETDDALRQSAEEYGLDADNPDVIENLRLYL